MASRYAPTIDATGISAPDFATVLANLTADYYSIFGNDVVLDNSTQDGQFIGVQALAISDTNASIIASFNSFRPGFAIGAGLSSIVKINGVTRKIPSASIATLTITGQAGITITNGQAFDGVNTWALPASVQIPGSGTIDVVAACTTLGAIEIGPGDIDGIATPTYGWQSVTNAAASVPGTAVETDAALRVRRADSVALPSQTIFEGIVAALQALTGVTRAWGYENNTALTDGNGLPARTLYFVVEGGAQNDIYNAIATRVTPGMPMQGGNSTNWIAPSGSSRTVKYDTPTDATINVTITLKQLSGWSATTEALITAAVQAFLAAWPIGGDFNQTLSWFELAVAASLQGQSVASTFKITQVTLQKNSDSSVNNTDIALLYNEATVAGTINYTVT